MRISRHLQGTTLKRPRLTAFLCALIAAAIFILPFILRRGGILYVSNDQITQQMPFTQAIVRNLHSGHWLYDFNLDLGSGVVEGYTWYNLGSVFSLILLLFPAAATPYLLGPMLILKFGAAGLTAFLWLRRHTQTDLAALTGSLCYALSGIAVTNMVFPFADVYALFPLLPLGMDLLLEGERPAGLGLFAAAVAMNALANPPLFFGSAVFMLLYFGVRAIWKSYALSLKRFALLAAETLCGLALSCFIMLPFVASLAANPRVEGTLSFGRDWFIYIAYRYFKIFRALVTPPEVMHANSMFLLTDAVSPELYLPMFALVPALAYVLYKKRDWLRALLIASLVCMLVPVLNSAFNAFNGTYYTRWLYAPVLAVALATAHTLEQPAIPLRRGYLAWGASAAGLAACMLLWRFYFGYSYIISYLPLFVVNLILCVAGLIATGQSRRWWRAAPRLLPAGVMLFGIATGFFNLLFNQAVATADFGNLSKIPQNSIYAANTVPLPKGVYRINSPASNLYFGHGSPFSFNSTVPPGVFELQAAFGRQRTSASRIEYDEPGLWSLLGVKYLLLTPQDPTDALPNTVLHTEAEPFDVWENLDALPYVIGFDAAIAKTDAEALGNTQKSIAMLHGLVLEAAALEAGPLSGLDTLEAGALGSLDYDEGVAARKAMAANRVELGSASLSASLTMPTAGAALITLPYDAGWRCTVDGVESPLLKADWGLMATPVTAGRHQIELSYRPTGFAAGGALSLLGLAGLGVLLWQNRRKKAPPGRGEAE